MSFLLDTHVWIWTQEQPDAIGAKSRAVLETNSVPWLTARHGLRLGA